jgi:hypothetical protein
MDFTHFQVARLHQGLRRWHTHGVRGILCAMPCAMLHGFHCTNSCSSYVTYRVFVTRAVPPTLRWQGYIKDYDGGTLMECVMLPQIRYTQFPSMIHEQRCALDARLRAITNVHVIYKVAASLIVCTCGPMPFCITCLCACVCVCVRMGVCVLGCVSV